MDENHIQWDQIRVVYRPGMTGMDLANALCDCLGLNRDRHWFMEGGPELPAMSTEQRIQLYGLFVIKPEQIPPGFVAQYDGDQRVLVFEAVNPAVNP